MSKGEGNILVLKETESNSHGIILVVGREPNNNLEKAKRIDHYGKDWKLNGNGTSCQYWNMAYTLCGRITGHSRKQLKGACSTYKSSPIAFADLSPLSLDGSYSPAEKIKLRKGISAKDYENHLRSVFSHKKFMKRVNLVVCAGHKGVGLTNGYPILEQHCKEADIPYCHIPSLNSTRHSIEQRLLQMGGKKKIVADTFESFFQDYELKANRKAA